MELCKLCETSQRVEKGQKKFMGRRRTYATKVLQHHLFGKIRKNIENGEKKHQDDLRGRL